MDTVGERIRILRNKKKLTQQNLANQINVSSQVISNWERGYTSPDYDDITKLADALEATADYLLGRSFLPLTLKNIDILEDSLLKEVDPLLTKEFVKALQDPLVELFLYDLLSAQKEEREDIIREFLKIRKEKRKRKRQ